MLWHIMKYYAHWGHDDFLIALGYKGEYIKRYFVEYSSLSPDLTISFADGMVQRHENGSSMEDWTIRLIDTGIQSTNQDFYGRAKNAVSFVTTETTLEDTHGHGTHVSGTIGSWTYGVAKRVNLFGVKTLDANGTGYFSWIIAGVNYAASHVRPGKTVINLSLGGNFSAALNDTLQAAYNAGAVVVVASGNQAVDACTVSPGGSPAVVSVGALDSTDTAAPYSNFGPCVTLYAPGTHITSLGLTSGTAANPVVMSGTSMASPHAAGVAALWMADWDYTPATLYNDLRVFAAQGLVKNAPPGSPNRTLYSWGDYKF